MTLKMIWAIVALAPFVAAPVLAVNPPESAPGQMISISGDTNVCLGDFVSYTCLDNEWPGWTNAVSYTWIVDGATNSCNSSTLNITWNTAGSKVVTVIHDSNAKDGNGVIITNYNGQTASLTVAVVKVEAISPAAQTVCFGKETEFQVETFPTGHYDMVSVTADGATNVNEYSPATGKITVKFNQASSTISDYKTVTATCGASASISQTLVIKVESIEPDPMENLQEIDDGDDDSKTRVFIVSSAYLPLSEDVVVRAKTTPVLEESEVPLVQGLNVGNGGIGRLYKNINREGESKTEFTCWLFGADSGLKTTVYVYDATVGFFSDGNYDPVGHAWGEYTIDDTTREDLINVMYWPYFDTMGFYPEPGSTATVAPGDVRLGAAAFGEHTATGSKHIHVDIKFTQVLSALYQVQAEDYMPEDYNIYTHNCTDFAIWLGELMSIDTMDASGFSTPQAFADWLNL